MEYLGDKMSGAIVSPSSLIEITATGTLSSSTYDGATLYCTNSSAITLTVPPNSTTAWAIGTEINVIMYGAGTVTFAEGSGVTINSISSYLSISDQYGVATLKKMATDTWLLIGNLAT